MLKWFNQILGNILPQVNPLDESEGFYVSLFKDELTHIADSLSAKVRFNPVLKCAEFLVGKQVVACVHVYGEVGLPYGVVVNSSLSEKSQALFAGLIPDNVRFETLPS